MPRERWDPRYKIISLSPTKMVIRIQTGYDTSPEEFATALDEVEKKWEIIETIPIAENTHWSATDALLLRVKAK